MIEHITGATEAGIYGAAVRLSELVYALSPILVTILLPRLARLSAPAKQGDFRALSATGCSLAALLGYGSALGLSLAGGLLISLLFGHDYQPSVPVLMIHCFAAIPMFLGEWRHAVLVALNKPKMTAWFAWGALLLNVGLNLLWIPRHGAQGAAWATLVSYCAGGLCATWLVPEIRWLARLQSAALLEPLCWLLKPKQRWMKMRSLLTAI